MSTPRKERKKYVALAPESRAVTMTDEELDQSILKAAGVTPEEMGMLVREAVTIAQEKFSAKETKFFTHQGQIVDTADVENHAVQLKAIDMVLKLANAYPKTKTDSGGPAKVTINMPNIYDPKFLQIEAEQAGKADQAPKTINVNFQQIEGNDE